jgi:hypothetical protein
MRNEVFVYLEIYSVYFEIYEYGEVAQGVRFPAACISDIWIQDLPVTYYLSY